ncbi:hypothetical protein J7443_15890 [Tropicibacter sp. R15_0]|uniref:hypothetical protein n=1 Tax=Tropicibacter sp. R15_0 TaxID=2821101 RepID=UPI001ADB6C49|nr:hypothetical protein [Tropicibacter sp. R15_0]MBO9466725.1 hypothetical protein [Tropicibacter sp. R15_0]
MAKTPITYANSQPDLPGGDFIQRLRHLRLQRQFAANSNARDEAAKPPPQKDPSMVAQEQPHPLLKPSPHLTSEVDARAFNGRWAAEQHRAATLSNPPQPQKGQTMSDDHTNRPTETLREGALKAAIWRNESETGAYHTVTVARTYKDKDGNLQDTSSLRGKDMLSLAELARRTHHDVRDLDREAFKEQRRAQAEPDMTRDSSRDR